LKATVSCGRVEGPGASQTVQFGDGEWRWESKDGRNWSLNFSPGRWGRYSEASEYRLNSIAGQA